MDSRYPVHPVLVVDDEDAIRSAITVALSLDGISNVVGCADGKSARRLIAEQQFVAVILDIVLPDTNGPELMDFIREHQPNTPVLFATVVSDVHIAVDLMKRGAFDYLAKPIDRQRLRSSVRRAIAPYDMATENESSRDHLPSGSLTQPKAFSRILTVDDRMTAVFSYVEAIAPTTLPVLIRGETGTGKELLAEALHNVSRRSGEFVVVNTAGLDDQLLSDTLFGHVVGAYTGSMRDRQGLVARASRGTLFLDEIGDLSPESQVKLLRLVQQREYYRLGDDEVIRTDARMVFATNRDLEQLVLDGQFRQDLYFRLRSHQVELPPLRHRRADIGLLVDHFLEKAARETGKPRPAVPHELIDHLATYDFPGNIRELEGMILDAVIRHGSGVLSLRRFDEVHVRPASRVGSTTDRSSSGTFPAILSTLDPLPRVEEAIDALIREALRRTNGNQTAAARALGMGRTSLNRRMRR